MNDCLAIAEQRLLWALVANGGEGFNDDLEATKKPRSSLARSGLIEVEKRKRQARKKKVPVLYLRLTDAGWAWCNLDMAWQKPRGKAERFLNTLLQRLKVFFERQSVAASLADFLINSAPETAPPPASSTEKVVDPLPKMGLDARIRAACLELGGGREAVRVRLADLRERLADVPADELTETVRELSRRRELTLYPLDDPRQITPEDRAAAIPSSTDVPQHILYYGGIPS
jgi:hypothetical protein